MFVNTGLSGNINITVFSIGNTTPLSAKKIIYIYFYVLCQQYTTVLKTTQQKQPYNYTI